MNLIGLSSFLSSVNHSKFCLRLLFNFCLCIKCDLVKMLKSKTDILLLSTGMPPAPPTEPPKPYKHLGCWKDPDGNVLTTLERKDPVRLAGSWKRDDAIQKCYEAALASRKVIFGVQYGGSCSGASKSDDAYKKYGVATNCADGKGGAWSNDVYKISTF